MGPQRVALLLLIMVSCARAVQSTSQPDCGGRADIVFLLDKSGSVGRANFQKTLDFIRDVSSKFQVGPDDVQIGVNTFDNHFKTEFTLGQHNNTQAINTALQSIRYTSGGTNTRRALTAMRTRSFTAAAGHRTGVPKIAIVVTDGKSGTRRKTAAAAQKARDAGIHMMAIGVGSRMDNKELNAIASDPDSRNVLKAATFNALRSLKSLLAAKVCQQAQIKQKPATLPPCTPSVDQNSLLTKIIQLETLFIKSITDMQSQINNLKGCCKGQGQGQGQGANFTGGRVSRSGVGEGEGQQLQ